MRLSRIDETLQRVPVGAEAHPVKVSHQPEASLASSSAMAARSVDSECRDPVIEPRNKVYRASLRLLGCGGSTEPTQRIRGNCEPTGETERAGMETLRLRLEGKSGRTRRGLRAGPRHGGDTGEHGRSRSLLAKRGTRGEGNEAGGRGEGSLSPLIVPIESRETDPREPGSREGEDRGHGTVVGPHRRNQRPT